MKSIRQILFFSISLIIISFQIPFQFSMFLSSKINLEGSKMNSNTKLNENGIVSMTQAPKPILVNVTYETPLRDLDEERKYQLEHLNYLRKVKGLEEKYSNDIDALKMMMNIQNLEIEKLNEVIMANSAVAYQITRDMLAKANVYYIKELTGH